MVTLRGDRMYEFLDRLVNVALPRVRDFRGVSTKSFDGRGNYTLGIKDQLIFPEIDYNKVEKTKGMNISITTTARDRRRGAGAAAAAGHAVPPRKAAEENSENRWPRPPKSPKTLSWQKRQAGPRTPKLRLPPPQPLLALRPAARVTCASSALCRICFRKLALNGEIPGVIKASW